ncbi:MAG: exopolysaccharide Pel transporter PelG [Sulfurimonas sp.]|uniref:exopolysaccharide Pel transporter PelG n=1 Tax=Sulfurimonas sp. TaxID=2022749 RepID=UPI00262F9CE0|nr:exopolysaccharide Pel transporter PelG [Sulfurimonas sp.]MDD5400076.1 exopolysaccharide Pel transporter PelG [Sulfurimonas sp.]
MAGIGFELRRILKKDRLLSLAKVYSYSAVLSSGPWVISIVAIILVGFVNISTMGAMSQAAKFQIVITYAIALASSLVVTGVLQLPFTRYVADLIFEKREDEVLPSYFGAIFLSWLIGLPFVIPLVFYIFDTQNLLFLIGVISIFLILCGVWISSILAASLKYYIGVVWAYFASYAFIVLFSYLFGDSIEALMFIFFIGNSILFVILMTLIIKSYNSSIFMKIDFFFAPNFYWSLGIAGLAYNLGAWVDKFIFWYHPLTGNAVIGKLNASVVYDIPIFLAYLSILPGMAIFFYRLEADFAEKYELYYDSVRNGGTLDTIRRYRNDMVDVIRHAIREIIMIQGVLNILLFLTAPSIFKVLNIPQLYLGLLYILTIGAMLQVSFMSVLAILYYLDRKLVAMWLCIAFFVSNGVLTYISIDMGPAMFGYGYASSLLLVFTASVIVIRNEMNRLDYETFMLQ